VGSGGEPVGEEGPVPGKWEAGWAEWRRAVLDGMRILGRDNWWLILIDYSASEDLTSSAPRRERVEWKWHIQE
jgi:hypothetical protein